MRGLTRVAASALAVSAALAACSTPQARYKVLSFFFDGVPDPNRAEPAKASLGRSGATVVSSSTHRPFAERKCAECHRSAEKRAGVTAIAFGTEGWAMCSGCHSDPGRVGEEATVVRADRWLHGPVAIGECRACHEAHRSDHPHLLRAAPAEAESLCYGCHESFGERTGGMAGMACLECHDPHAAAGPADFLLRGGVAEACTRCHVLDREARPWVHGPVGVGACGVCHDAHGAAGSQRHVRRPIADACFRCHEAAHRQHCDTAQECDVCHDSHSATQASDAFLRKRLPEARPAFRPVPQPAEPSGR